MARGRGHLPEDRLLNEEHVATSFLYFLANVKDVLLLFAKNTVHLRIIRNNDLILHLERKREIINVTQFKHKLKEREREKGRGHILHLS